VVGSPAPRAISRAATEGDAAVAGARDVVERHREAAQDLGAQGAVARPEQLGRLLQALHEAWIGVHRLRPPLAADSEDGAGHERGGLRIGGDRAQSARERRRALEGVGGPGDVPGFGVSSSQAQQHFRVSPLVGRGQRLGFEGALVVARGVFPGEHFHRAVSGRARIGDGPFQVAGVLGALPEMIGQLHQR
jgi:hypothetical protein